MISENDDVTGSGFINWDHDADFENERVIPAKALPENKALTSAQAYDALNAHEDPNGGMFVEICQKCRGTGRYFGRSSRGTACFACKGEGKFYRKTSPEARARAKANAEAAKIRKEAAGWEAFVAANPTEAAWMTDRAPRFNFAAEMVAAVSRFGHLTEGQMAAVKRLMAKDAERDAQRALDAQARAEAEAAAPRMEMDKLEAAFATAKDSGLKRPVLRVAGFKFSPAPLHGKNAGAIYVKDRSGEYLGKVASGKFVRSFSCDEVTAAEVLAAGSDPLAAAVAYGRKTGECACCGRELTDGESIARGIGPICATKWGL